MAKIIECILTLNTISFSISVCLNALVCTCLRMKVTREGFCVNDFNLSKSYRYEHMCETIEKKILHQSIIESSYQYLQGTIISTVCLLLWNCVHVKYSKGILFEFNSLHERTCEHLSVYVFV